MEGSAHHHPDVLRRGARPAEGGAIRHSRILSEAAHAGARHTNRPRSSGENISSDRVGSRVERLAGAEDVGSASWLSGYRIPARALMKRHEVMPRRLFKHRHMGLGGNCPRLSIHLTAGAAFTRWQRVVRRLCWPAKTHAARSVAGARLERVAEWS